MASVENRGISVRALKKSFPQAGRPHQVLNGIDLDIAPGEVVGLIGPNGAGKTTLMSCLLGFLFADSGAVSLDGLRNDDLAIRRRTGFVPERMNFDRRATGRQFLRYMTRLAEVSVPGVRVEAVLERLGVAGAANKRLSQYSRGMLQRVVMAQALIHDPDFLFLDEPASGLDPQGIILVRELIAEQKKRGAAVLLNSHQLAEVERVCDRVLLLAGGVIAEHETLRPTDRIDLLITLLPGGFDALAVERAAGASPSGNVVRISVKSEAEIADVVQRVVRAGAGIIDVRRSTPDLEEFFRRPA